MCSRQVPLPLDPPLGFKKTKRIPCVSIVTPCLNPGARLFRCLGSVRRQTYPLIEHIVVDGSSSDGTVEFLKSSKGIRWVSERDNGQAAAINKGFSLASGEILTWLNADDELEPAAIETGVRALQENDTQWVYGNIRLNMGGTTKIWAGSATPARDLFVLGMGNVIPQPGALFTSSALTQAGGLDETFHLCMDFDLWLRFLECEIPFTYIPTTLATFEVHSGSKTGINSTADFSLEEAKAYLKIGRERLALIAVGRAAAHAAYERGRVRKADLTAHVSMLTEDMPNVTTEKLLLIWAAARTEAAFREIGQPGRGLRHLLTSAPWRFKETRTRLLSVAMRMDVGRAL